MNRRTLFLVFALLLSMGMRVSVTHAQAQTTCMSAPTRLAVGMQGRVTPGLPNVLRAEPVQGGNTILAYIPAGGVFAVLAGPACGGGITWWQVSYNGVTGWTPEGQWSTYWAEPVLSTPTPDPAVCALPPRLAPGVSAVVTPGLPNRMRVEPALSGRFMLFIPAGAAFQVLSAPVCANGMYWYQVNYNGAIGWTAEGRGSTYWLQPS